MLVEIADHAEDLLALTLQDEVIELLVLGLERNVQFVLLLGRQLCGDEIFGAPEHERPHPPAQPLQPSLPSDIETLLHRRITVGRGEDTGLR